jgi:twitching motility protein PilT
MIETTSQTSATPAMATASVGLADRQGVCLVDTLDELLALPGLSDIHLTLPPALQVDATHADVWVRLSGVMQRIEANRVWPDLLRRTLQELHLPDLPALHHELRQAGGQKDLALGLDSGVRLRNHTYLTGGVVTLAMRLLPSRVPEIQDLGLPGAVPGLLTSTSGLIFVCGGTGSGKTTTLAALVGRINATQALNIMTLEDPIEYIHKDGRSRIRQRLIGPHGDCLSFSLGVVAAMREDPDVILVGEVRDHATMHACLQAAQTGHLVLATLHTNSAPETIDRALSFYQESERDLARSVLASSLRGIVAQRLLPRAGQPDKRVLAAEVLLVTQGIRANIAAGQITQVAQTMETGRSMGQQTLNHHLAELVQSGMVSRDDAIMASTRPDMLTRALDSRG